MLLRSCRVTPLAGLLGLVLLLGGGGAAYPQEPVIRPEFVPQTGHAEDVESISFSPDGRWLATASRDQTVKIWNVATGELIRTLTGFSFSVSCVRFSPDGQTLAIAQGIGTAPVELWDWQTGAQVKSLPGPPGGVNAVVWWPDSTRLAAGFVFGAAMVWDIASGERLASLTDLKEAVTSLALSPDGRLLYAAGNRSFLRLLGGAWCAWRTDGWQVQIPRQEVPAGVRTICLTPDGKSAVIGELRAPHIRVLDATTGKLQRTFTAQAHEGYSLGVDPLAVSPDGRLLAAGYNEYPHNPLGYIALWDLATGRQLGTHAFDVKQGFLGELSFFEDGSWLAATNGFALPMPAAGATEWRVAETEARWLFTGSDDLGSPAALLPSGKGFVAGRQYSGLSLWDLVSGRTLVDLEMKPGEDLRDVAVMPDGRTVLGSMREDSAERFGGTLALWDTTSGKCLKRVEDSFQDMGPVAVSDDGAMVAWYRAGGEGSFSSRRDKGEVRLWSTKDWTVQRVLAGHTNQVVCLDFSPDGSRLVSCAGALSRHFYGGEAFLWDVPTGERLTRLDAKPVVGVTAAAFSPDGRILVTGNNGPLKLWDGRTGAAAGELDAGAVQVLALRFSRDGKLLACAGRQSGISLWSVADRKQVGKITRPGGWVRSVDFTPDGSRLLVASADGTVEVWHLQERRRLATCYVVPPPPDETATRRLWLTVTPEGYYDCAEGADHVVKWRHFGQRMVPFYQFEETYRRPDLVRKALAGGRITEAPLTMQRIPPVCEFVQPAEGATIQGDLVRVLIAATDDAGIAETTIHVNGVLVPQAGAKAILAEAKPIAVEAKPLPPGHKVRRLLQTDVPLPAGQEKITIRASVFDAERNRGDAVVNLSRLNVQPVRRNLYALCIGVSQYRNPTYNLQYAAADATALAELLRAQEAKGYAQVHVSLLTDKAATVSGVREALRQLSQATENDLVVVFLSGHGAQSDGRFYFATHSLFVNDIPRTCVNWSEMIAALSELRAKRILLADACHSGTKLGERQASNEQLAEAGRRSGIVIMASSRGEEFSFEDAEHRQGSFTVGLLEGLGGQADLNKDGHITLPELEIYVPKRVTELTGGLQHPHLVTVEDFDPQAPLTVVR